MCMTDILLFICLQVWIFGSKNCRCCLIHTLSWQKGHTLQALMMSLTILQNIMCWKRKVSPSIKYTVLLNSDQETTNFYSQQNREEWEGNLEITSHPVDQKK